MGNVHIWRDPHWRNNVFFFPIKILDTNWQRFTRYSKSFLPPFKVFYPTCWWNLFLEENGKLLMKEWIKIQLRKCDKKIRRSGDIKCSHFGRNMVHHWNTHFGDVLSKKNCNFTNSSLMFIFLFVNETYDTFTFLERFRRWDFQYFEFSFVDFSPFTCEIFQDVNGIFSTFSLSQDILLLSIVDCDGIVLMRRKDRVVVYNQLEMILSINSFGKKTFEKQGVKN